MEMIMCPYYFNRTMRIIPMPMMTTGLDNKPVAVEATPCTVWPAVLAIEPIVLSAVLATEPIELVTVPTSCPGIAIILLASPPMVPII